jgi:hypothetical protein
VQYLGKPHNPTFLFFFLWDKCKSTNWPDRQTAEKRDKPLHELDEDRADYKALEQERSVEGFTGIVMTIYDIFN